MNNLKIMWGQYYYLVYAPEDTYGSQDYSWFVTIKNNRFERPIVFPSVTKWKDYNLFSLDIPVDVSDKKEFKAWLETAYALGELPVGEEKL
jgi:hypothetical protein